MSRGIAIWLVLAVIFALSTATYGEVYKAVDSAKCVAEPGSKCMIQFGRGRGSLRRCDCTPGYACMYSPYLNRYICDYDVKIDPDIRKIFF